MIVDLLDPPSAVQPRDEADPDGGRAEDALHQPLARPDGLRGPLPLGHVDGGADHPGGPPALEDSLAARRDPALGAVAVPDHPVPRLVPAVAGRVERPADRRGHGRAVVGVDPGLEDGVIDRRPGRQAPLLPGPIVPGLLARERVPVEDADRGGVEREVQPQVALPQRGLGRCCPVMSRKTTATRPLRTGNAVRWYQRSSAGNGSSTSIGSSGAG